MSAKVSRALCLLGLIVVAACSSPLEPPARQADLQATWAGPDAAAGRYVATASDGDPFILWIDGETDVLRRRPDGSYGKAAPGAIPTGARIDVWFRSRVILIDPPEVEVRTLVFREG